MMEAFTMPDMVGLLEQAYTPIPQIYFVEEVPDFRDYFVEEGGTTCSDQLKRPFIQFAVQNYTRASLV